MFSYNLPKESISDKLEILRPGSLNAIRQRFDDIVEEKLEATQRQGTLACLFNAAYAGFRSGIASYFTPLHNLRMVFTPHGKLSLWDHAEDTIRRCGEISSDDLRQAIHDYLKAEELEIGDLNLTPDEERSLALPGQASPPIFPAP